LGAITNFEFNNFKKTALALLSYAHFNFFKHSEQKAIKQKKSNLSLAALVAMHGQKSS